MKIQDTHLLTWKRETNLVNMKAYIVGKSTITGNIFQN